MTPEEYAQKVTYQIELIVKNISKSNDELVDSSIKSIDKSIKNSNEFKKQYGLKTYSGLGKKEENEYILTNWIYCHYYQNRNQETIQKDQIFDELDFPFNDKLLDLGFEEQYWRNSFWKYDVHKRDSRATILNRGYQTRFVLPEQFVEDELVFESNGRSYKYLSLIFPKFEIQESEKFIFGSYPLDDNGQGDIIRFYFNLKHQTLKNSIPDFIKLFNDSFNNRLIPFHFKFWSKSTQYTRADNLILYLESKHFFIASCLLTNLYDKIKQYLDKERLPFFVREVLPGIGFGKSPQKENVSFGVMRSTIIAEEILKELQSKSIADPKIIFKNIENTWGGLQCFFLNPKPSFKYSFGIFSENIHLVNLSPNGKILKAAIYIANLLCREAIWLSDSTCNWMSYQEIKDNSGVKKLGYSFSNLDGGFNGIEGIFTFLKAFESIDIKDSVIHFVAASACKLWKTSGNQPKIQKLFQSEPSFAISSQVFIQPIEFSSEKFKNEVMGIITGKVSPTVRNSSFLKKAIEEHIDKERPLGNMIDGTDNFHPDLQFGLAGYGYALLRIYAPDKIPALSEGMII